ncbi:MAG TPA: hypothetical protein VNE41_09030 [Chitinophagaceae bacterium]|nr:hypothetical protein [Chitinophagaceae bacterium]
MPAEFPLTHLLSKGNQEEPGIGEIRDLVRDYPYFSAAQVILAIKLQEAGYGEAFHAQLARAVIYLPDSFLLNKLLLGAAPKNNGFPNPLPKEDHENTGQIHPQAEVEIADQKINPDIPPGKNTLPVGEKVDPGISLSPENELDQLIRPLYTEDYFAFQGIRLPEQPDDTRKPTSAQMRSFTDWLRAMKRPRTAPDPDLGHQAAGNRLSRIYTAVEEGQISTAVEKMALDSISTGDEVITEAMAEIRIRQGQTQKAIAIYEKLGLLNPGKSGYFADKIAMIQQTSGLC